MKFILNDRLINTDKPAGMTLLDFVRYDNHLTGTKIGCREGDCGACTVLIGELVDGKLRYTSMTSCITPLANAVGKHVVTIEGLNMKELSPVQEAFVEMGGTQCGFCTAGFVVSLSGYCMSDKAATIEDGIGAIDGNICRCTGYKSIERATAVVVEKLQDKNIEDPLKWLLEQKFIPDYFKDIPQKLTALQAAELKTNGQQAKHQKVGGGTDLYVQRPDEMMANGIKPLFGQQSLKNIVVTSTQCEVGAEVTVTNLLESANFNTIFPNLRKHLKLVSSTQIRNMGTLAGNFVNASPIGDMTIFFLALDSTLVLESNEGGQREVKLKEFYHGYKDYDLREDETVVNITFNLPDDKTHFNFEKVSKRTYLDIASVNSAIQIKVNGDEILQAHISAGGVGPIPMYLTHTSEFLAGKSLAPETIKLAVDEIGKDISPISDVRGSKEYKTLLLRQLIFAHFIEMFPEKFEMEELA